MQGEPKISSENKQKEIINEEQEGEKYSFVVSFFGMASGVSTILYGGFDAALLAQDIIPETNGTQHFEAGTATNLTIAKPFMGVLGLAFGSLAVNFSTVRRKGNVYDIQDAILGGIQLIPLLLDLILAVAPRINPPNFLAPESNLGTIVRDWGEFFFALITFVVGGITIAYAVVLFFVMGDNNMHSRGRFLQYTSLGVAEIIPFISKAIKYLPDGGTAKAYAIPIAVICDGGAYLVSGIMMMYRGYSQN